MALNKSESRYLSEEKNGNDDDKHDSNETDDIDEIACGSANEPDMRRPLKMVIACTANGVCLISAFPCLKTNFLELQARLNIVDE